MHVSFSVISDYFIYTFTYTSIKKVTFYEATGNTVVREYDDHLGAYHYTTSNHCVTTHWFY